VLFNLEHWQQNILFTDTPDFDVRAYIAQTPHLGDYNLREKLETWRDIGVVVFENCISNNLIEAFLRDISHLCENSANFALSVEYKGTRYQIKDLPISPLSEKGIKIDCIESISLAARHLSLSGVISSFLSHVFQEPPAVIQSLTFWRGSEQLAHLDYPWVRVQTRLPHLAASWIPLEDIHVAAGPLAYYPGSHKQGLIPPFDWGNGSLVQEPDSPKTAGDFYSYLAEHIERLNLKKELFLPKRGDVLIWHGNVLHEGTEVRDVTRTRRSYVTHYTSLGAYPAEHRFPDAFENKRYIGINGGYAFDYPWVADSRQLPSSRISL
jgi:phytanoyl-CoA hydroxylase